MIKTLTANVSYSRKKEQERHQTWAPNQYSFFRFIEPRTSDEHQITSACTSKNGPLQY